MWSNKTKYILYLAILNCLLTALLVSCWTSVFEYGRSMGGITLAMAMFFLYELFVIIFTENKYQTISPRQSINLFLGFKVGKIILSFLFIVIYISIVKVERKRFIMVFVALYLIYLLFDTLYLVTRERSIKKKQYKLKEIEKVSNYYKK